MKKKAISLIASIIMLGGLAYAFFPHQEPTFAFAGKPLPEDCAGTPARMERELKWGVEMGTAPSSVWMQIHELVYAEMKKNVAGSAWQVPTITGEKYYIESEPMDFVAKDFYLDTPGGDLFAKQAGYRLRYRFKNEADYLAHETDMKSEKYFPYRVEIQSKTERQFGKDGGNSVKEARFEFREESQPFSATNLPPQPPWPLYNFLEYAQVGVFEDYNLMPACELARFMNWEKSPREIKLAPAVVLKSIRSRLHLNVLTDYGTGPNPTQAFIISFDDVTVYDGKAYTEYLALSNLRKRPEPIGRFMEFETEFERNISTKLDETIATTNRSEAVGLREAFLADQKHLVSQIKEILAENGFAVKPSGKSKFDIAYGYLEGASISAKDVDKSGI